MADNRDERGFVLVTSLVILMILTVMLIGLYYRGKVNQDTGLAEGRATQAFYLAEAGLNYVTWALYMDPNNTGSDNDKSLDGDSVADNLELESVPDQVKNHTLGYFDIHNTINYNPASPPTLSLSSLALPPHVALNITVTNHVPSVSPVPWVNGTELPGGDGAVVWLVPATLDETNAKNEADTALTSSNYAVYAYAIGYVNGKPLRLLRAKIGKVTSGFPSSLGSMTNGYQLQ